METTEGNKVRGDGRQQQNILFYNQDLFYWPVNCEWE
jgi:hypothetical protein